MAQLTHNFAGKLTIISFDVLLNTVITTLRTELYCEANGVSVLRQEVAIAGIVVIWSCSHYLGCI